MKIAFTTTLDDNYLLGFLITLNSILRVSKNFNYDLVIFEWGSLSDESKSTIKQLYNKVIFKKINSKLYENHEFDDTFRKWTYNCNYRFDIFTMTEYDRVVFFDCDMIFQIDVDEILKYDVDFGASFLGDGRISQIDNRDGFDAGLMTIGKKYLNDKTRDELIKIANSPAPYCENLKTQKWFGNEPILNNYFLDKMVFLPENFNKIVSQVKKSELKEKNNYQFTGNIKPWDCIDSNDPQKKLSQFTIRHIKDRNGGYFFLIIYNRLMAIVNDEIQDLIKKNINVYRYSK
jgi:lipopolysaccharide biosynthesis glycosyltransferase